ncbi:hypothetical protein B7H18_08990 [Pseudomonas putida]|nr:hypothetical protein B7H18_08990 [Pseudomonas putida]PLP92260.1 hypothetical protein CX682_09970 [Pseudomonas sp. FFUP_PS_41]
MNLRCNLLEEEPRTSAVCMISLGRGLSQSPRKCLMDGPIAVHTAIGWVGVMLVCHGSSLGKLDENSL